MHGRPPPSGASYHKQDAVLRMRCHHPALFRVRHLLRGAFLGMRTLDGEHFGPPGPKIRRPTGTWKVKGHDEVVVFAA